MQFFLKIFSDKLLWFSLISITLLGVIFYLFLGQSLQKTEVEQILNRKRVIARAEASNIIFFFERFSDGVATLAQLSSIKNQDKAALADLDAYVEQRREDGFLGGVILTDKDGVVKLNSNVLNTKEVGESIADRDYFVWAKEKGDEGEYFISGPIISRMGATEGQTIFVIASPIYKDDQFIGAVSASVKLQPLIDRFTGLMKVLDQTKVYLIDGDGALIYSRYEPHKIGTKIAEIFSEDQILSERITKAQQEEKGDQFISKKNLVAYTIVNLVNQKWLIVIVTPLSEVVNLSKTSLLHQTAIFVLLTLIIFLLMSVTLRKRINQGKTL